MYIARNRHYVAEQAKNGMVLYRQWCVKITHKVTAESFAKTKQVKKDTKIKQDSYAIKLAAYGWNAYAEKTFTVDKPPVGSMHKEIWMHEAA